MWVVLCVAGACSYDEPNLDDTQFKCGGMQTCPSGQICLGGLCQHSGRDRDGVVCGAAGICGADEQCCVDSENGPRCIAASAACPGTAALCDGVEDCDTGSQCCELGVLVACGRSECSTVVCVTGTDCPSDQPNCCPNIVATDPWGTCQFNQCPGSATR